MSELLPCPFCGGVGLDFTEGSTFRWLMPSCKECGASCGEVRINTMTPDREAAIEKAKADACKEWNTRNPSKGTSEWKPIESAPKDGQCLLWVATDDGGEVMKLMRDKNGNWLYEGEPTFRTSFYIEPTHWMPLPPPPELVIDKHKS